MPSKQRDFYSSHTWRKIRLQILERDQWQCQIRSKRCTELATQVDHIVPVTKGGAKYDPRNLRASCHKCNNGRINRSRDDQWVNGPTHITLVMGPPAAGKSTYVRTHARAGDLIVDYDAIATSLGANAHTHGQALHPAINAARNAILRQLRRGETGAERAWILSANPEADRRFPFHELVMVDPGLDVALENARTAHRPRDYMDAIRSWYATRTGPDDNEPSRTW
jgi:hypothetical protein